MFPSEANHLLFTGSTGDDVLPVTAALHNLITKQGYKDIILDFNKVEFVDNSFVFPLVSTARFHRAENVDFELILPEDPKLTNLFRNANWAHLISPERFDPRDERNKEHLSAIQFTDADDHFKAVDRSMDLLLRTLKGLDRSRLKALEWSLNEITDNVLNHSESPVGGIVQVTTFPRKHCVEFYVCDAGIGIPRSLRQGRPDIRDDASAMRAAVEEGVTRDRSTNQGNGLFGTFKCCEVSGGEFDILSSNVSFRHRPGTLKLSTHSIPFRGTFVRASIRYKFEKLLERALVFRGKAYDPATDYVERVYQAESEDIQFKVNEEFVHLISSSFADEVFGKLFHELGPIGFGQLCKFRCVDPTVQKLIDRAIAQRMKQ